MEFIFYTQEARSFSGFGSLANWQSYSLVTQQQFVDLHIQNPEPCSELAPVNNSKPSQTSI